MNNQEEQQGDSHLIDIMKKHFEEEPEEDASNKFHQDLHPLNAEPYNNLDTKNVQNKSKQDSEQNYEAFLNAGGDKLISNFNKLSLGNNTSNQNQTISPKKIEHSNFFQNPNINMNNKNNQKDLAFNYFFGSGLQTDLSKKTSDNSGKTVSSQILEHLGFNPNNDNEKEQQFKNYLLNKANENNNQNEDLLIKNNSYKLNPNNNLNNLNNINQSQQGKMMINMNFPNKNNNNNKISFNDNQNPNMENKINNINNINNVSIDKIDNRDLDKEIIDRINNENDRCVACLLGCNVTKRGYSPMRYNPYEKNVLRIDDSGDLLDRYNALKEQDKENKSTDNSKKRIFNNSRSNSKSMKTKKKIWK